MIIINDEQRKLKRGPLNINLRVEVKIDKLVSWDESAAVCDISTLGAGFTLTRPVEPGHLVRLTIPMPRELRSYDFRKDDYNIWALVRRCIKTKDANGQPRYSIGVAFVGKTPPDDYLTHPASTFILSNEEPENNDFWRVVTETIEKAGTPVYDKPRRQSRLQIPEEVTLKLMDENGWEVAWETSVTKNISKGGAEVLTQLPVNVGSFVRFSTSRNNVQLISVVRGKHTGQGGVSTINLEFIDMHYPIDLHA